MPLIYIFIFNSSIIVICPLNTEFFSLFGYLKDFYSVLENYNIRLQNAK